MSVLTTANQLTLGQVTSVSLGASGVSVNVAGLGAIGAALAHPVQPAPGLARRRRCSHILRDLELIHGASAE
jgi:hypothetical protein